MKIKIIKKTKIIKMEKENSRKLEEERKKKEEEEKKQLEQETTNEDIQINVGIKSIELDGNNNKENNIKLIENLNEFNQIILKDMSKEHLEFLFSNHSSLISNISLLFLSHLFYYSLNPIVLIFQN